MIVDNLLWFPILENCLIDPNWKTKMNVKVYQWCWPTDTVVVFEDESIADLHTIEVINNELAQPNWGLLTNLCEAVQDCVWESIEWFDYSDVLNQWLLENPFPIKHTIQWTTWAATLNPDDIINITIDSSVSVVTVDETVPTLINVKIPATAPYVKAIEAPTPNTRTPIIHNLNTPVPWLYAYDGSGEYIDIEWKYIDTNTVEYRTTTSDSFTYYIKS